MPRYIWRVSGLLVALVALGELCANRHTAEVTRHTPANDLSPADEREVHAARDSIYCQWLSLHQVPARDGLGIFRCPFP